MSVEELGAKEHELQEQIFKLRMQKATAQLQNSSRLGEVRRDIARIKTVLREKRR
jgi:large subunit ribosomal protein L29